MIRIISAIGGIVILLTLLNLGKLALLFATIIIFLACLYEYIILVGQAPRARRYSQSVFGKRALHLIGLPYLALIFTINASRQLSLGQILVFFTLLGTWAFDAAAYFVGSRWGKHKITPKISPNKSLEGFLAGLIAVSVIAIFLPDFLFTKGFMPLAKTGWIIAMASGAFIGDLIESFFKRNLEIKDSSNLIPGHGGFLDRFDSLILTSVFSYFIYRWLM